MHTEYQAIVCILHTLTVLYYYNPVYTCTVYLYINGAAIARCGLVLTRAGSSHGMAGTMTIALTPAHNTHHF